MNSKDTAELLRRIRSGDRKAEQRLIEQYSPGVWTILARWTPRGAVTIEDLYQDVWEAVITKIRAGENRDPEHICGFIVQTARYVLSGAGRREYYRDHEALGPEHERPDQRPPAWMAIDERFRARLTKEWLKTLGRNRRDLIMMYVLGEYTREEIMATLQITPSQLSRRLFDAKRAFQEFLENRMGMALGVDNDDD